MLHVWEPFQVIAYNSSTGHLQKNVSKRQYVSLQPFLHPLKCVRWCSDLENKLWLLRVGRMGIRDT